MRFLKFVPMSILAASLLLGQGAGSRRAGVNPGDRLERLATELSLTDDQKNQIKPILEQEGEKMRELRDNTSLSRQEKMQKMQAIMTESHDKINPILTDEQRKKAADMRQNMGAGRRRPQQQQ